MSSENEKKKEKEKEAEPETLRRGLPRRDTRTRQSRADDEKPKTGQEKSKSAIMSEDIFDMEVRKGKGEKKEPEKRKSSESKKRSSVVESDEDSEKPVSKRPRPEGPLSPNSRRMSTNFEKRQSERRKSETKLKTTTTEDSISQLDLHPSADGRNDFYCWICHKEGEVVCCDVCPRVYHEDCMPRVKGVNIPEKDFFCPECTKIQDAENTATRLPSLKNVSTSDLAKMLNQVVSEISVPGVEIFRHPVDVIMNPTYPDYIFHPMDLGTIKEKVLKKEYGSTDSFLADMKWIQHNSCIFNTDTADISVIAKKVVRKAEEGCLEIEKCPDCVLKALVNPTDWFTEPCEKLHPIVFGRLQGYPIWPGKAIGVSQRGDSKNSKVQIEIRFFGQHDRAWVNLKDVYCYSKEGYDCKMSAKQKVEYETSMKELSVYCENFKKKHGPMRCWPQKTQFDPNSHFEPTSIIGGSRPEVPKIPPLKSGRPQSKSDRLSALISKANEIKGRSPNPSSDGESNPASPADPFEFPEDKDDDSVDLIKTKKKNVSETISTNNMLTSSRPAKRPRPESPAEKESESVSGRPRRNRTESPKPKDETKSIPPPPPKVKSRSDEPSKNAYSAMEKERRQRALDKKKPESPKSKKIDLSQPDFLSSLDRNYPVRNSSITDLGKSSLPVQGLPPGILIGNYTDKVMNNIQAVFKDVYQEILKSMDGGGHVDALRLEVDRLKWQHEMELNEMKHNHELTVAEIRQSVENEKKNALDDLRKKLEKEKESAILETKKKQWCANCGKEAVFYCCWNTSYCDYPCQQGHWPQHMTTCSQGQGNQRPT